MQFSRASRQEFNIINARSRRKMLKTSNTFYHPLFNVPWNSLGMKGASTWLTTLPIDKHGFALHKAAFRDSLSLRYGWPFQDSPSYCSCGQQFSVEHALSCKTGGFPVVRHNEVRDITATLLTEVCHEVKTEPHLQPLSGESLSYRSANTEDSDRFDVAMYGFWGGRFN